MHSIHFNTWGNIAAALFFSSLPLIFVVVGALTRRKFGENKRWLLAKRYWYLPLLLPLVLYYGIIYRWLFYDQFYWITIEDTGAWKLEYYLPARKRNIWPGNIESVQDVSGDIWTYKMIRILISTADGMQHVSAQISPGDRELYLDLLDKYRSP